MPGFSKRNFKISSIFLWKILIFAVSVSLFTHWLLTIVCYWSFQFASRVKYLNMLKLCHFMTCCFLSPQVVCEALKRNWSNLFSIAKSPRTKIIIVALPHAIKFTRILFILLNYPSNWRQINRYLFVYKWLNFSSVSLFSCVPTSAFFIPSKVMK